MDAFQRATALAQCLVLERVPAAAVLAIAERSVAITLSPGQPLPVRTDGGDAVLVITSGRARVGDSDERGPGRLVGELAAIDEEATATTAVAIEPTVVLRLYRDDFLDLLAEHPAAARALARELAVRIRR